MLALWFFDPFINVDRCKVVIPETNETFYFRRVAWGLGSGHWQVVFSHDRGIGKRTAFDKDTEYLFYEPDGVLYRVVGKTLEIHLHWFEGPKPSKFLSKANIRIINYDYNPDWQELLTKYMQLGLTEVSDCAEDQRH